MNEEILKEETPNICTCGECEECIKTKGECTCGDCDVCVAKKTSDAEDKEEVLESNLSGENIEEEDSSEEESNIIDKEDLYDDVEQEDLM